MSDLVRGGAPISSIFGLHGTDENHLSAAFAYGLSASPKLRRTVIARLGLPRELANVPAFVRVQTAHRREGITDVELSYAGQALIIFEAKQGSKYPSRGQLRKYARRCRRVEVRESLLVALTSTDEAATPQPRGWRNLGVPVKTLSWLTVLRMVRFARRSDRSLQTKFILREIEVLLEAHVGQEKLYSNMVYVVSLGSGKPRGWKIGWQDIVAKRRRYFYLFDKKGWPSPPNYMAFRYRGRLQSIHHVVRYDVTRDLPKEFREAGRLPHWRVPHYLLHLGPPIRPARVVKTGRSVFRNARVWCMLDTLLTSPTVSKALDRTKKRIRRAERESRL